MEYIGVGVYGEKGLDWGFLGAASSSHGSMLFTKGVLRLVIG